MYETVKGIAKNGTVDIAFELTRPNESSAAQNPALLFVGGWGEGGRTWARQVAHFAPNYPTLIYDRRGLGASSRPTTKEAYTVTQEIADLAAVLTASGLAGHTLWPVGHSYGCHLLISWLAQGAEAAVVEKLALTTPTAWAVQDAETPFGCFPADYVEEMMAELLAGDYRRLQHYAREAIPEGGEATEPLRRAVGRLVPDVMSADVAVWIFKHYFYLDLRPLLAHITIPVLAVSGELDTTMPAAAGADLVKRLKNARHVVFPQIGHLLHLTAAPALNQTLEQFFLGS